MLPNAITTFLLCFVVGFVSSRPAVPVSDASVGSAKSHISEIANALSGEWSIEFTISPSEVLPKGGSGHGEEVWKTGPGRLSLIEEYRSVGDDGDNTGLGTFWWDEKSHRFQVLWCANDAPSGCDVLSHGAVWQDNSLVLTHRWQAGAKHYELREVFSQITPISFTQTIYRAELPGAPSIDYVFHAKRKTGSHHW